jgi:hypothetical protein
MDTQVCIIVNLDSGKTVRKDKNAFTKRMRLRDTDAAGAQMIYSKPYVAALAQHSLAPPGPGYPVHHHSSYWYVQGRYLTVTKACGPRPLEDQIRASAFSILL